MKKATKSRMTKADKQLKSMLNYFEISVGGEKDEAASPEQTKQMMDTLMNNYDANTLSDIIKKIRDNMIDRMKQQDSDMDGDADDEDTNLNFENRNDRDLESIRGESYGTEKHANIEKFLSWLSDILHTDDHAVKVMTDGNGNTQIFIQRMRGGKSSM